MKTILNKLIFGVIFIYVGWKGLDGLFINLYSGPLLTIDIAKLNNIDASKNRHLCVLNGLKVNQNNLIYYQRNPYTPIDVLYPVISHQQKQSLLDSKPITIKLLVKLSNQSYQCVENNSCTLTDSTILTGLTEVGIKKLNNSELSLLENNLLKIDENVIILEQGASPINIWWNLAMFIAGTIFACTIWKSFVRKANTLNEYWTKITEQD